MMKSSQPLVSVVMPAFNEESSILRAVQGVLNQTYQNLELIVVDDASRDKTVEILQSVKDTRLKIIKLQKNLGGDTGGSGPRNVGMKAAKGEYIALNDADDQWDSQKLEKQLKYIQSLSKEYAAVSCWPVYRAGEKDLVKRYKGSDLKSDLLNMNVNLALGTTLLFHRRILKDVGYFDETFPRHQDYEYSLRILRRFKIGVVPEPLVIIYGHKRAPNADLLVQVKKLFLETFKDIIESYAIKKQNAIYARSWLQVSRAYALEGNLKMSIKYLIMSLQYSLLFSSKYKIIPFETYFVLPYLLIRGIFKNMKSKNN